MAIVLEVASAVNGLKQKSFEILEAVNQEKTYRVGNNECVRDKYNVLESGACTWHAAAVKLPGFG